MRLNLVLLPVLTTILLAYSLRTNSAIAPRRLAVLRGALATGAYAVVGAEVLSVFHLVDPAAVGALWATGLAASAVLAGGRHRHDGAGGGAPAAPLGAAARATPPGERAAGAGGGPRPARWAAAARATALAERLLGAAIAVLVLAELLLALVSAPNN